MLDRNGFQLAALARVIAPGVLPFLGVIAWGSIFDSRGGEPFAVTVQRLFLLSPFWFFMGLAGVGLCHRWPGATRTVLIVDAVLLVLITSMVLLAPT